MAFFNKKKKSSASDSNESSASDVKAVKAMGKKKVEGLSSILRETVPEAVIEEFKKIPNFCTDVEGETVYVGLALNADDIGGLSKKDKKDEAKGSIAEAINTGRFASLLTQEIMDENIIVFIPTRETIVGMQEFGILTKAPYRLCYVETGDDPDVLDIEVTLTDMMMLYEDDEHIDKFLIIESEDDENDEDDVEESDEPADEIEAVIESSDDAELDSESLPFGGGIDDDGTGQGIDLSAQDAMKGQSFSEETEPAITEDEVGEDEYVSPDEEDDYFEEAEEVEDDVVDSVVTRVFYSEDLGLDISTAPFDAKFVSGNVAPALTTDRGQDGTGGLADVLAEMAKDANAELKQLHQDNLFKMKSMYTDLLAIQCEKILETVSTRNPTTQWAEQLDAIKMARIEKEDAVGEKVASERESLTRKWEETLERVGEEASRIAKQQHIDRFGRQYEETLRTIENRFKDEIEREYQDSKRSLVEAQRQEATTYVDVAINEILMELADVYEPMRKAENDRFQQLQTELRIYEDKYRTDEAQRIMVLERELKLNSSVEKVRREAAAEIEQIEARVKSRSAELDAKQSMLEAERKATIERITTECEARIQAVRVEQDKTVQEMVDLKKTMADEIAAATAKADKRIKEMQKSLKVAQGESDVVMEAHKKSRKRSLLFTLGAFVVALIGGVILGCWAYSTGKIPFGQTIILDCLTNLNIGGLF